MLKFTAIVILLFYLGYSKISHAVEYNYEYQHCTRAINFYEKRYNLPADLLYSIVVVESGKWNKGYNKVLPWPWSLNVEGKPYYFSTKLEAVNFLKKMIESGVENIDIGCSQINWYYHGKKYFKKPEHVLNPVLNISYAAYFLSRNYALTRDWKSAVARYHSRTEARGNEYFSKVSSVWRQTKQDNINRNSLRRDINLVYNKLFISNNRATSKTDFLALPN